MIGMRQPQMGGQEMEQAPRQGMNQGLGDLSQLSEEELMMLLQMLMQMQGGQGGGGPQGGMPPGGGMGGMG